MSNSKKKSNFIVQGSILAVASIISRIIGLLYRLPMTDITRTDSMLVSTSLTRLMVQILLFF